ncbi:MAG TPA: bifunctional phosphoribosylaminoimidazolecarboxamide formyltransferase/IMP cyclohydrolase [Dictyoglomaceae bacterium]|nr:bifunctional phosphoribosylaminoimidazolecarboxamide formyltransferase/IMP cyclohydrolase [Dictyoglomaceae bacterium]HOL39455.1 bifunctional phosphoribosylaminoimidazolecarboxamide formyltransferase/IMP cyclohydrolase [Dictyoglomaceae bacterium]HPP15404.1 bifunctional phosphoribosylaminoimidazolecarboxamide formyltransferase/IMP cyclohydrolase [Dictyoglomaceae bacterium]HPU43849.1 bifunctional phosphoribosylaminoimidazolecarboxamide formyltransferase/IMP cyclohydrolase [Dictyoglomaceae bacter
MPFALVSVYDKNNIEDLCEELKNQGFNILATSSTAKYLKEKGFDVTEVSEYTGFKELIGGRVKTLHPKIFAGILARRDKKEDLEELKKENIPLIDIVVCNLYPFSKVISKKEVNLEEALENIDIGGVSLLRAAAKNFPWVLVVSSPEDYARVIEYLKSGKDDVNFRRKMAIKAFSITNEYDGIISSYLLEGVQENINLNLIKRLDLRYGENPQQKAGFYTLPCQDIPWIKLQGKELSFNNLTDMDSAWNLVEEFSEPTVAIIKHNNPCGVASDNEPQNAFLKAFESDPVSAYGGIIACNFKLDEETAKEITKSFFEVVIAPDITDEAKELLSKKKNLRVLISKENAQENSFEIKTLRRGFLVQDFNKILLDKYEVKTSHKPDEKDLEELLFALKVVKHTKSNAIVVTKNKQTLGIGAGQMNRVQSVRIALEQAGEKAKGAYLASDAFFPFSDSIELAAKYGIKAVIQPGGSIRDNEVIEAAEKNGIILVMIDVRHFRH